MEQPLLQINTFTSSAKLLMSLGEIKNEDEENVNDLIFANMSFSDAIDQMRHPQHRKIIYTELIPSINKIIIKRDGRKS